ncbi:hypothetical protein APHAL10511_003255 [Amanita phalloides]|nr:hypothetical protein APHAL10511_003255 [Amanita phalloides]
MPSHFWNSIKLEPWPRRRRRSDRFPSSSRQPWYTQRVIEILQFFLRCNRGSPFSFALCTERSYYTEDDAQEVMRVLLILVPESTRWQNASMNLKMWMLPTLYRIKHRLPLLRTLDLRSSTDDPADDSVPELYDDLFETAPLLASIAVRISLSTWKFNWSFLTFIRLSDAFDDESFYKALPHAVRLQKLQINTTLNTHRIDSSLLPITRTIKLPSLKHLSIISCRFLPFLEAPALVDFQIYSVIWDSMTDVVIDFLRRSSCQLHHLFLERYGATSMTRIWLHAPDVRHLCILSSQLSGVFIWLSGDKSGRVPDLETLRVFNREKNLGDEDLDNLLHLVTSRACTSIDDRKGLKQLAIYEYQQRKMAPEEVMWEKLRSSSRNLGVDLQVLSPHTFSCPFCDQAKRMPDYM